MTHHRFVILDLETTGVRANDQILEIGAIEVHVTPTEVKETKRFHTLVVPVREFKVSDLDPVVQRMHENNVLFSELSSESVVKKSLTEADASLAEFIKHRNTILCGYSVHFDHKWIVAEMPKTAALLSHKILDLRSVSSLLYASGVDCLGVNRGIHRSIPDCEDVLENLKSLNAMFRLLGVMQTRATEPLTSQAPVTGSTTAQ